MASRIIRSALEEGIAHVRRAGLDFASAIVLGLGMLCLPAPILLLWFIHADNARYEWLISGPPPFDQFGSGPVQLALVVGLWILALGLLAVGLGLRRRLARGAWTPGAVVLLALGVPPVALALLALGVLAG
jgi:hypothetical protein